MYMGYISNDGKNQNNPEAIGERNIEREPTPEEIAAGEQRATEWNEALGVKPVDQANFSESMADVVPFQGDAEVAPDNNTTNEAPANKEAPTSEETPDNEKTPNETPSSITAPTNTTPHETASANTSTNETSNNDPPDMDVTPLPVFAETAIVANAADIALNTTPGANKIPKIDGAATEKTKRTPEEEAEDKSKSSENTNADGENQRTMATVTEKAAEEQINSNDINVGNLVQNVAGETPGGEETIIRDADTASTNIAQAESAANGLVTKVANSESDGFVEGKNILNAAMVSAANMSVTTEKAAASVINEHPDAETDVVKAKDAIEQTKSVTESLGQAATQVRNPELAAKMQTGVQDVEAELARSQDLLAEATDAIAKEAEEKAEEEKSEDAVAIQAQGQQNEGAEMEDIEYAPGQMNADAFKHLTEEREEEQKAAAEAAAVEAEQATDENMSYRRAIYG